MDRVTQAILIRAVPSGESDLAVTLLSPEYGKFDALMKGVKKPKAKLKAYAQPFCFGEYTLSGEHRPIVTGCAAVDFFYDLASRTDAYFCGNLILEIAAAATDYDVPAPLVFLALLRALKTLTYSDAAPESVAAKFMTELLPVLGYAQTYTECARCGEEPRVPHYSAAAGGITCEACAAGRKLADTTYRDILTLIGADYDDLESAEWSNPIKLVKLFGMNLETVLETEFKSLDEVINGSTKW